MSANLSQRCSSHCNTKQCKLHTRKCDAAKEGKYACLDTGKNVCSFTPFSEEQCNNCCDTTTCPERKPKLTYRQCLENMSCDSDPFSAHINEYTCTKEEMEAGNCTMDEHCQSIVNNIYPAAPDMPALFSEYDRDGNLACPGLAHTWNDYSYDAWNNLFPNTFPKDCYGTERWGFPRCKFSVDSPYSGMTGGCIYDPHKEGDKAKCIPYPSNCYYCNTNEAKQCRIDYPELNMGCPGP
jgi:hypothetical protein